MNDTITLPRSVVEQALEALYSSTPNERDWTEHGLARQALSAALEQPQVEQEPVASIYIADNGKREFDDWRHDLPVGRNYLYTHPQPPRQSLTDEEIGEIEGWFSNEFGLEAKHSIDFARAIERAVWEKSNGWSV